MFRGFTSDDVGDVVKDGEVVWYLWDGMLLGRGESPPIVLWKELGLSEDAIDLISPKDKKEKFVEGIPPEISSRWEWFVNEKGIDAAMAMSEEKRSDSSSE